ncbi:hypothetical protein K438DRAFT_1982145 [Mycena galopus ATCC 62051]|nr:hypothetical protein K438DRAFT_1982145 [Mycena galopus ATCC 62051]
MLVLASWDVRAPHASASANSEPRTEEAVYVPPSASNSSNPKPGTNAQILSGAVMEPSALDALPRWYMVCSDHPLAQMMDNRGNFIAQFSLSPQPDAEDAQGSAVRSVMTHDAGLTCQRTKSCTLSQAWHSARVLAEGAYGSLSKQAGAMYGLRRQKHVQTYGIGVKEVWRVEEGKHVPVLQSLGWPLFAHTYGGGWEYYMANGLISIGLVVGLDYKNSYLEPYREFQRTKHHPHFRALLANGTRLAYGAHALIEGGFQSLPQLDSPGRRWLAATVNTAKIKGTHNAMQTGMRVAEAAFAAPAQFASTASPGH